jgi:putative sterol carrier protein
MMQSSRIESFLFTKLWMERFAIIWNSPQNANSQSDFGKIGIVRFNILEGPGVVRNALVNWRKDGKMENIDPNYHAAPAFSASVTVWESMIYSFYTPLQAVVERKMEYEGKMKFAIYFSQRFESIANVAIEVNGMYLDR